MRVARSVAVFSEEARTALLPEEELLLRTALPLAELPEELLRTALPLEELLLVALPVEELLPRRTSCWLEELAELLLRVAEPEEELLRTALLLEELLLVALPVLVPLLLRRTSCWLEEELLLRVADPEELLLRTALLLAELRVAVLPDDELLRETVLPDEPERVVALEELRVALEVEPPLLLRVWANISGAVTRERTSTRETADVNILFMASAF